MIVIFETSLDLYFIMKLALVEVKRTIKYWKTI